MEGKVYDIDICRRIMRRGGKIEHRQVEGEGKLCMREKGRREKRVRFMGEEGRKSVRGKRKRDTVEKGKGD